MADLITVTYVSNPQALPEWQSYSTYVTTIGNTVYTIQSVVQLPQVYYGPSIPLGEGWTFGGSISPTTTASAIVSTADDAQTSNTEDTSNSGASSAPLETGAIGSSTSASMSIARSSASTTASSASSSSAVPVATTASPATSGTSDQDGIPTASLVLAIVFTILAFTGILLGLFLWRRRRRRGYDAVAGRSPALGSGGGSGSTAGQTVVREGQDDVTAAEGGKGNRWLPTILAASGLRQRSTSARMKHNNRVPSTNIWGDASNDDGYEMVDLPGGGAQGDQNRTPRTAQPDQTSVHTGRRGIDDTREELNELLPTMGEDTPTRTPTAGKGKFMAALGIGAARSGPGEDSTPPSSRQAKISQTDSSTPSSRQGFFPVGTAAKKDTRQTTTSATTGHVKSDSIPSIMGNDRDLFYSYPAEASGSRSRDRVDSGVADEAEIRDDSPRTGSGSRFSTLYAEGYSSASGNGSASSRTPAHRGQPIDEQDLAGLGLAGGLGSALGGSLNHLQDEGARTPNSYRFATSQMRFPVPPDRSEERLTSEVAAGITRDRSRSASAETSGTSYHSLYDQANTLTHRSRSSTNAVDEEHDHVIGGVDEHGRGITFPDQPDADPSRSGLISGLESQPLRHPPIHMIASGENAYEGAAETGSRRPRPVPLSALPSPISIDSPSAYTAPNRFSLIAGSISSLFGAKRSSVVSSLTEEEPPSTGRRPISLSAGRDRTSYAGQPLVGEDVYREAFLSGIPEGDRRDRQESSGETQESGQTGRKELSEGVLSEEDGSGETFGVKNGRGERARVVTPANRGGEKMRTGSNGSAARVGEFGGVIPVESGNEILRTPGDMRKTSALFVTGSPYSPAQASSQAASVQANSSKSSSNHTASVSKASVGTLGSSISGESLGVATGLYSVAAARGKRSMPQLVNTPDALAGFIPRTDTPPPATTGRVGEVPHTLPSTPPPRPRSTSGDEHVGEPLLPPKFPRDRSGSLSSSEKRREKEKWWLGRFGQAGRS